MPKKFQRKIEDFVCGNCGAQVTGNGYTNHCPNCLWSMHVDINPGDRQNTCGGMMKPISVEIKSGEYILTHKCAKCGFEKRNKTAPEDNFEEILKLANAS
jgi:rubrerythrin